jgi:soluble lytic murein transglycosylase
VLWRWFKLLLFLVLLIVLVGEAGLYYWREHQPRENPYDPIITSVAKENGVDPFLIRALIWRESRFDPSTHGAADERGLMQVRPVVGEEWAKAKKIPDFKADDLYDVTTNIRVGTWRLARSIRLWTQADVDDPVPFALAEYNAGRSNALKWVDPASPLDHNAFMERITFPGTRKYVEVILAKREQYRTALAHDRWYQEYAAANPTNAPTP